MAAISGGFIFNQSSVKPVLWECYQKNDSDWVASRGLFLGDNPLEFSLPLAMIELLILVGVSRVIHFFLKRLGQCQTVSNIIAGIIVGPSILGQITAFRAYLFPAKGTFILDTLSLINVLLFLFVIGVKTDLNVIRKPGKMVIAMALLGSIPPLIICTCITLVMQKYFPQEMRQSKILMLLSLRLCLPSFPVIADILDELQILNSELGRLVVSTSLISDVVSWGLTGLFTAGYVAAQAESIRQGALVIISLVSFFLVVVLVARPTVLWIIKQTPIGETIDEGYFVGIIIMCLIAAFITEVIGFHATFGPVILGLALPGGMPLGVTLSERVDTFGVGMFVPLYLSLAGLRTDLTNLRSAAASGYLELIVAICYLGKLIGTMLVPLHCKMSLRDAFCAGLMMNLKGVVEISFLNNWGDLMYTNSQHYSIMVLSLMMITATSTPLIKYLYKPTMRYVTHKRRTVQHSKPNHELRVLACVHNVDNVAALVDLLEASNPNRTSPLSVIVLHLTEIAGRAAPILAQYKKNKKSTNTTPTDRIVNAFRYFEQQNEGGVAVNPYIAICPGSTMHNDVCQLAFEKKTRLVILPFHKLTDGALATAKTTFQALNRNVLDYAPCSVAILVDGGIQSGATCTHTNKLLNRVAIYFFGGPDDREALSYGIRMAGNAHISLTVVRFLPKDEQMITPEGNHERKLDDQIIGDLHTKKPDNVLYMEELVNDGEGTVGVIRSMNDKFDLLIVGRRKGQESPLTAGLSVWSECPELGLVGDILASTDFAGKVSILVVQQQERPCEGQDQNRGQTKGIIKNMLHASITNRSAGNQEEARDGLIHRRN